MSVSSGRLSSKGQIVIPKQLREELSLSEGDDLVMLVHEDVLLIKKITLNDIIKETDRQYKAGETLSLEEAFRGLE